MQGVPCIPDSRPKHAEIDIYTKNKLCTKLVLVSQDYTEMHGQQHLQQLLRGSFETAFWNILSQIRSYPYSSEINGPA